MKSAIKGILAAFLALSLASGWAGVCATAKAAPANGCCAKSAPAAPAAPCPQMACCRPAAPNAAVTAPPVVLTALFTVVALPLPADRRPALLAAAPECGPPDCSLESHAGRSPPRALLG